jgi:predicted RND superfamily exporter protein
MRDLSNLVGFIFPKKKEVHISVLLISCLMVPGFISTLTPIDIESYSLDSPELEASEVMREEFAGAGNIWGFGIFVKEGEYWGKNPSEVSQIKDFNGEGEGLEFPTGGILNLTILKEIDDKKNLLMDHEISKFYLPLASDISGQPIEGVFDLASEFRFFMNGDSLLTKPKFDPDEFVIKPASTNWNDCGELECLSFDDENTTQAHIDLAAHRMANNSNGAFLRFLSIDRAFLPDLNSKVIGPINGELQANGTIIAAEWSAGRWSASSAWLILNMNRELMQKEGWTFSWMDASYEFGYTLEGVSLKTQPIKYTNSECKSRAENGSDLCSVEWLYLSLEEGLRETDDMVVSVLLGEGQNVEVNRELLSSAYLIIMMVFAVIVLLWFNLRRLSDVVIVGMGLILALLWMQGLIGWCMVFGQKTGLEIIFRSQFSNLLPILILALGIDDSLHALHRYKEERRTGKSPVESAEISISKVGRAVLLTSLTTIMAFMANLTSDIAALRSFGIEAGFGVAAAFILTGLWVPIVRMDVDLWLQKRNKLDEEDEDVLHMIPKEWLGNTASQSAKYATLIACFSLIITIIAAPMALSLEGDFEIDDFLDDESDFVIGVNLVNERFRDGEPGYVLIEGDIANPAIISAISEMRDNMNSHDTDDPNQISRTPTGEVELIALDQILMFTQAAFYVNSIPFEDSGWDRNLEDGGIECETMEVSHLIKGIVKIPILEDRECLNFLYGFILTKGVPATAGYPALPTTIVSEYIHTENELNISNPWLTTSGETPRYSKMSMRFGLSNPEQFALIEPALAQLQRDMVPFQNLSESRINIRGDVERAFESEDYPITWAIQTGDPVIRFVAADSMQDEMQETLLLGLVFCMMTLWWGFRSENSLQENIKLIKEDLFNFSIKSILVSAFMGLIIYILVGLDWAIITSIVTILLLIIWGTEAFGIAMITTAPIFLVIIWLYGMIEMAGYGLNMVTVSIAAISLGVGIDYVIHIIERFREERENGREVEHALRIVGASSGLALFGSAISDIAGFAVINQSDMGFFSTFGLFCAIMIGLSLIASIILTPAALSLSNRIRSKFKSNTELLVPQQ